jgi:hypothetical protein
LVTIYSKEKKEKEMQPSYGLPNIDHHHQQQQQRQQHLMEDDYSCSPSVLPISNLQNLNYPYQPHLHHYLQQHKHPHQVLLQQHHQLFYPFQQQQQVQGQSQDQVNPSLFSVNFKWGRDYEDSGDKKAGALNNQEEAACTTTNTTTFLDGNVHSNPPHAILMPHSWHPREDSTTLKEPFW